MRRALATALAFLFALAPLLGRAAELDLPAVRVTPDDGGQTYSVSLQVLVLMTLLTVLPSIVIMMTAFTRIIVVFAILRQALGLQQTPSNQILIGLALFLTLFVMRPVFVEVNEHALQPYLAEEIKPDVALQRALAPFRRFMLAQTREEDLATFVRISGASAPEHYEDIDTFVLIPAFVTSELKTAFQIGFMLFVPFLVIDMVVASVLMSMGMMMLSPLIVSLPFKLMLFVLIDGWVMVVGTLASSFRMTL